MADKGRKRWNILKSAVISKPVQVDDEISVKRSHDSLKLFASHALSPADAAALAQRIAPPACFEPGVRHVYTAYTVQEHSLITCGTAPLSRVSLKQVRAAQEAKIDNTGNVCVWPSEEVLAFFCLHNQQAFNNMDVMEVGGGMSGLAGLVIARFASPKTVTITDGNPDCVDLLKHNIEINFSPSVASSSSSGERALSDAVASPCVPSARLVRWDRHARYERDSMDVVVGADCLFFEWCHEDLLHVLSSALRPSGVAFLVAPSRGGSLERFVKLAEVLFQVEVARHFNDHIYAVHTSLQEQLNLKRQERASTATPAQTSAPHPAAFSYDPDLHWPILVKLSRAPSAAKHDESNDVSDPPAAADQSHSLDVYG